MRRTAVATAVVLVLLGAVALASTRAYFVEPKELHTGKVAGDGAHGIRQTFVANVDSIAYIEWFVGELSVAGQYEFEITQNGQYVCGGAESVPTTGWRWVRCSTFTGDLRFTKGKEYLLQVSRGSPDLA